MMLYRVPAAVKTFVRDVCEARRGNFRRTLATLLVGIMLVRGRRTLANLATVVVEESRHRSSVSRFLQRHADDVLACYSRAFRRAVARAARASRKCGSGRWLLAIDTTFQRKHSLSMPSLIKFRDKSRGVPARNHAFVQGVLLAPGGRRIPLPLQPFMTREFLKTVNQERREAGTDPLPYRTQLDLAVTLVQQARAAIPRGIDLWVVADNFFEGPKLDRICGELGVTYVTTLDCGRVLKTATTTQGDKGTKVRAIEKTLPDAEFRRVALEHGKEPLAVLRRREARKRRGRARQDVYQVAQRVLPLSGLGERTVFFSWKGRRRKYNTARAVARFKMLVTNNPDITAEEAVDAYSLRWQIELFFRELKTDLGLGHYQVLTLDAIHAYVHLVLLAYLLLEDYRDRALRTQEPAWLATYRVRQARTRQLVALLEADARREEVMLLDSHSKRHGSTFKRLEDRISARKVA